MAKRTSSIILKKHEIIFIIACLDMILNDYDKLPLLDLPKEMWEFYRSIIDIKVKLEKLLSQSEDNKK